MHRGSSSMAGEGLTLGHSTWQAPREWKCSQTGTICHRHSARLAWAPLCQPKLPEAPGAHLLPAGMKGALSEIPNIWLTTIMQPPGCHHGVEIGTIVQTYLQIKI